MNDGLLAQLVEQGPLKPKVLGSIPRQPTKTGDRTGKMVNYVDHHT